MRGRLRSAIAVALFAGMGAALASCAASAASAVAGSDHTDTLLHNGRQRSYIVHLPKGHSGKKAVPLLFVLHGGGGNARGAMRMTGMNAKSDREGFIVVYPNGTGRFRDTLLTWNAGHGCGYAMRHRIDDVGFFRRLIALIEKRYKTDPKRIYVTGMSNGGLMAFRLGIELSDKIAAIGPVVAAMFGDEPKPAHPVSVIMFNGTSDDAVPYRGGSSKRRTVERSMDAPMKPVRYSLDFWAAANGCTGKLRRERKGNVEREAFLGCGNGTEVVLYTIRGGRHAWPGGQKIRRGGDEPSREISATDVLWEFFLKHPKH